MHVKQLTSNRDAHVTSGNVKENVVEVLPKFPYRSSLLLSDYCRDFVAHFTFTITIAGYCRNSIGMEMNNVSPIGLHQVTITGVIFKEALTALLATFYSFSTTINL